MVGKELNGIWRIAAVALLAGAGSLLLLYVKSEMGVASERAIAAETKADKAIEQIGPIRTDVEIIKVEQRHMREDVKEILRRTEAP